MGVLTRIIEIPCIPESYGLLGSALSGRHLRGRGWILASATVNHVAELHFCTKSSISVSAHPSYEVGTWLDKSVGVTYVPLSWKPSKVPADSGSMD